MSEARSTFYLYNTLTRRKEAFIPRREGEVSIYVCGVTPYDDAHIGHARPSVFFDVVRKTLKALGWSVQYVQNFTDIDDKIIARAAARGVEAAELADEYSRRYLESMDRLGVARADRYPKVSEHIEEIVEMIAGLIDKGAAYESEGNVFFAVDTFPDYGKLSKQQKEELLAGEDVEAATEKKSPLDFALWKAAKPGEPAWSSPWGMGRPGWHIECSAMSLKYLGNGFDIHGGGLDLVFPHHENEIAQSESFTGEPPFVRYWMHNGLVNLGTEKMSKSLGNFVTIDDLLAQYDPAFLRLAILQHHYRSPIDFDLQQLESAHRGWGRLNDVYHQLRSAAEGAEAGDPADALREAARRAEEKFFAAMADDFNTPVAIASLFELVREARPFLGDAASSDPTIKAGLRLLFETLDRLGGAILGILSAEPPADRRPAASRESELIEGLVRIIIDERAAARKARDFARADALRDALDRLGIALTDTPEGTHWSMKR